MPSTAASISHSLGDPRDQLQFSVAFSIVLAGRLWRVRFADRMKALSQTDARWTTLYMIADASGGITQTRLAERLSIQGPTLVKLLDALEKLRLIKREPAAGDRRAKMISIEPAGSEVLKEIDHNAGKMRNEMFAGVSDAALSTTLDVLRHLSGQLDPAPQAS